MECYVSPKPGQRNTILNSVTISNKWIHIISMLVSILSKTYEQQSASTLRTSCLKRGYYIRKEYALKEK